MKRSRRSGISIGYPDACISSIEKGPLGRKKTRKKISLNFLMKTNSTSLLCLQFVAQAFGVKGVEMCPHSSLTALEPALIGVGGVR